MRACGANRSRRRQKRAGDSTTFTSQQSHQWHWLGCLLVPIGYTYLEGLSTATTLKQVTYFSSLQGISQCDLESYSSSPFARLLCLFSLTHILSSLQNLIHNPEINRLLGIHEIVANHELLNLVQTSLLCQVLLINLVQSFPDSQDLLRVICNVARLARVPPARLVDHDSCVWQDVSVSSLAAAKQQRAHRCCLSHTDCADWAADVVHCVVNGEACTDTSTWRVDIQRDWLFRIVGLEEQELCNDHGGHGFFDFAVQANDALLEQTREDVRGFPASALQSQPWGEIGVFVEDLRPSLSRMVSVMRLRAATAGAVAAHTVGESQSDSRSTACHIWLLP
jgi:hypothetical protein